MQPRLRNPAKALKITPNDPDAHNDLGLALKKTAVIRPGQSASTMRLSV